MCHIDMIDAELEAGIHHASLFSMHLENVTRQDALFLL